MRLCLLFLLSACALPTEELLAARFEKFRRMGLPGDA